MRRAYIGAECRLINRKAVILAGDQHTTGGEFLYRVIGPVMSELHLYRLGIASQSEQLMSEADAEHRDIGFEKLLDRLNRIRAGLRVTGSVGEKNPFRIHLEHAFSGCLSGHDCHATTVVSKPAQDVAFDAEVVGHDMKTLTRA